MPDKATTNPGDICPDCAIIGVPGALCPRHAEAGDFVANIVEHMVELTDAERRKELRDWFAGLALQGIIAAHAGENCALPKDDWAAKNAYEYADAMLAERTKPARPQEQPS